MAFFDEFNRQLLIVTAFIIGSALAKRLGLLSSFRLRLDYWPTAVLIIMYVLATAFFTHALKDK